MSVSTTGGRSTVGCARGSSRTTNRKPRLGRAAAAAATAWTALLTARAGFLDTCPLDSAMVLVGGSAATRCFSPRHGSRRLQKKKSTRPTTIWVWGGVVTLGARTRTRVKRTKNTRLSRYEVSRRVTSKNYSRGQISRVELNVLITFFIYLKFFIFVLRVS